jgi:tripartite-type tricarboxylate transporter receptor subunit TctC
MTFPATASREGPGALARGGAALLAVLALPPIEARSDSVADFYRGKQINLIVGYGPGGGYDVYAREFARHFGKYVPGNPSVVVQNMPGAGSLRATNYLFNVAPKDGTTIGTFSHDLVLVGLLGRNPNIQFDIRKFIWLGSASSSANDAYVLIARADAPVKTVQEARRPGGPPLVMSATAEGGGTADFALLLREALGFNVKLIAGYSDSNAMFLAVERKEIDARFASISTLQAARPEWLTPEAAMRVLVQFARVTRLPSLPDVPTAHELARDSKSLELIELAELPRALARPFVAPPGLPADRALALQAAFLAVLGDPQYLEEAARLKIDISPVTGKQALQSIDKIAGGLPEALDHMRNLLANNKAGD